MKKSGGRMPYFRTCLISYSPDDIPVFDSVLMKKVPQAAS